MLAEENKPQIKTIRGDIKHLCPWFSMDGDVEVLEAAHDDLPEHVQEARFERETPLMTTNQLRILNTKRSNCSGSVVT